VAIVRSGNLLLEFVITAASESVEKQVWQRLSPSAGARAAILLTHAMAAISARMAEAPGHHLSRERHISVSELLTRHLPWPDEDAAGVADAVARIKPKDAENYGEARLRLSFSAMQIVLGLDDAVELPGFQDLLDSDAAAHFLGLVFDGAWNNATAAYLEMTDPEGLAQHERARQQ
jgi:hypothetical protein